MNSRQRDEFIELAGRVEKLEFHLRLVREFLQFDDHPFTYVILENELTEEQMRQIFELMDETLETINQGNPMNHHDFERRVYDLVPSRRGNYHFAESIVSTLKERTRWTPVYDHMKANGMNI